MNEREFLSQTLRGNIPAVDFCMLLAGISQTWDDLIDADKTVDGGQVNAAFWNALIALPANAFYRQHQDALSPIMALAISDWFSSNELELGSDHDRNLAFVLRDRLASVVVQCACLVGGYAWMREVGPEIHRYFMDETLEEFNKEPE